MTRLTTRWTYCFVTATWLLSYGEGFLPSYPSSHQVVLPLHVSTTSSAQQSFSSAQAEYNTPPPNNNKQQKSKSQKQTSTSGRTLYQILGASPTDSRSELKQKYVKLAKQTHPDAVLYGDNDSNNAVDFTEVAAAWRTLSDSKLRLRYDRSLQAEQFTQDVQDWASRLTQQAAPAAKMIGKMAMPFLRKTTAATFNTIQAAANDLSRKSANKQEQQVEVNGQYTNININKQQQQQVMQENQSQVNAYTQSVTQSPQEQQQTKEQVLQTNSQYMQHDQIDSQHVQPPIQIIEETKQSTASSDTLQSATQAVQRPARVVDLQGLQEKSLDLQQRAIQESEQAADLERKLQQLAERRLVMALHTPGSGLTSSEALILYEEFNKTVGDTLSTWDRALMKHTIEYEIQQLQECERVFMEAQAQDSQAQLRFQTSMQAKLKAKKDLLAAENAEVEARLRLDMAQKSVRDARLAMEEAAGELAQAEAFARKCDYEMERYSLALVRQSEKVRHELRTKEREVLKLNGQNGDDFATDQVSAERLKEIKELRREERLLAQSSARLENKAARLLSRANKLRMRAEELEKIDSQEKLYAKQ